MIISSKFDFRGKEIRYFVKDKNNQYITERNVADFFGFKCGTFYRLKKKDKETYKHYADIMKYWKWDKYFDEDLVKLLNNPIEISYAGKKYECYRSEVMPLICMVFVRARVANEVVSDFLKAMQHIGVYSLINEHSRIETIKIPAFWSVIWQKVRMTLVLIGYVMSEVKATIGKSITRWRKNNAYKQMAIPISVRKNLV